MAQKIINVGSANNDNTGSYVRSALRDTNDNFLELLDTLTPHGPYIAGRYYPCFNHGMGGAAGTGPGANIIKFVPFFLSRRTTISHLMCQITNSPGFGNISMSIYAMNGNGQPTGSALAWTASLDASVVGNAVGPLSGGSGNVTLNAGWYCIGFNTNQNTIRCMSGSNYSALMTYVFGGSSDATASISGTNAQITLGYAQSYGSGVTWPNVTGVSFNEYGGDAYPFVWFRVADDDWSVPSSASLEYMVFTQPTQGVPVAANSTTWGIDAPWIPRTLGNVAASGNTTGVTYSFNPKNYRHTNGFSVNATTGEIRADYDFVILNECFGKTRTFEVFATKGSSIQVSKVTVTLNTHPVTFNVPGVDFVVGCADRSTLKSLANAYANGTPPTGWGFDVRAPATPNYKQLVPTSNNAVLDGWDCSGFYLYNYGAYGQYHSFTINNCYFDATYMVTNPGTGGHSGLLQLSQNCTISNCTIDGNGFERYWAVNGITTSGGVINIYNCRVINCPNDGLNGAFNLTNTYIHCSLTNMCNTSGLIIQEPLLSPNNELNAGLYWGHSDGIQIFNPAANALVENCYADVRYYRTNPYIKRRTTGATASFFMEGVLGGDPGGDLNYSLTVRNNIGRGGSYAMQGAGGATVTANKYLNITSGSKIVTANGTSITSTSGLAQNQTFVFPGVPALAGVKLQILAATGTVNVTSACNIVTGTGTNFANDMVLTFPTANSTFMTELNGVTLKINKASNSTYANLTAVAPTGATYTNLTWRACNTSYGFLTVDAPGTHTLLPWMEGPFVYAMTVFANNYYDHISFGELYTPPRTQSQYYGNRYLANDAPFTTYNPYNPTIEQPTVTLAKAGTTYLKFDFTPVQNNTTYEFRYKTAANVDWASWANVTTNKTIGGNTTVSLVDSTSYNIEVRGVNYNALSHDFTTFLMANGVAGTLTASTLSPGSYETETTTLLAAMSPSPDGIHQDAINDLIKALKDGGVWSKLDIFYMFAAQEHQHAMINWKQPGTYNLTAFGNMGTNTFHFTPDRFVFANNTLTNYYSTNFKMGTTGVSTVGSNTSNHLAVYTYQAGNPNNYRSIGSQVFWIVPRVFETQPRFLNGTTVAVYPAGPYANLTPNTYTSNGYFMMARPNSSIVSSYYSPQKGTTIPLANVSSAVTTSAGANSIIVVPGVNTNTAGGISVTTSSVDKLSCAHAGSYITQAEFDIFKAAIEAYLTTVGALT